MLNLHPLECTIKDNDHILFQANILPAADDMQFASAQFPQVYEVSTSGGRPIMFSSMPMEDISISADGKIIDCATTKQSESKGYGDVCGTDEYRDQWTGKTNDDIVISTSPIGKDNTDVGAIAGATYTTVGYQKAVKAAFAAFELLTENGGEG